MLPNEDLVSSGPVRGDISAVGFMKIAGVVDAGWRVVVGTRAVVNLILSWGGFMVCNGRSTTSVKRHASSAPLWSPSEPRTTLGRRKNGKILGEYEKEGDEERNNKDAKKGLKESKKKSPPPGLEPGISRLTVERLSQLGHGGFIFNLATKFNYKRELCYFSYNPTKLNLEGGPGLPHQSWQNSHPDSDPTSTL